MDLHQLRCFVAVAEELHFGNAAARLEMLPAALSRQVRLLEEDVGTRLLVRTTRSVSLTEDGARFLEEAPALLSQAESLATRFQVRGRMAARTLRVGAIDSAAAGLMPLIIRDFRERRPDVAIEDDRTLL